MVKTDIARHLLFDTINLDLLAIHNLADIVETLLELIKVKMKVNQSFLIGF